MIPTPPDAFEEWLEVPITEDPGDPRFLVRRATPDDFERIYDLVDAAFGRRRSREQYDWLYRRNPMGLARCWIVVERESGAILKTGARFPWPIWHGREPLRGAIGGDAATRPDWQRKGLSAIRRSVTRRHPWHAETCGISGPNAGSRAAIRSAGDEQSLLGRLRGGVAILDAAAAAGFAGLPRAAARPLGALADRLLSGVFRATGPESDSIRVEEIRRFTTDFDPITLRTMAWPGFWCPHNAAFLNWRYLDHPTERYHAFALVEEDELAGYLVLRFGEHGATLADFAVDTGSGHHALVLLEHAFAHAREAGCAWIDFFSTPSWRHWRLFYRAGFLPYRSRNQMEATCRRFEPEVHDLRNWQIVPGDRDYH